MSNGSALISSIRYYPNEKRIDFVPHATNEVGVHKVKVVATLNSKITANNQTKIEQDIEVTVVASNYPSVQTTVNQIEVEIFYDQVYSLPPIDNTGEFVFDLQLKSGPEFMTYDAVNRQLVFKDVELKHIKEYLIEMVWNTKTTVVKKEEVSETRPADSFNQAYLIDLKVKDVTGKLQVKAVVVEEGYVMGLALTYPSFVNAASEAQVMEAL